ncbi:MAG: hypothetical protein RL077_3466 [Verrucomicrobiota bacterium]|jgi:ankyrin repeat protein
MSFFGKLLGKAEPSEAETLAALRSAVVSSDTRRIKDIIAQRPDMLERADENGMRPLHWAAEAQSLSSVACLVDLGGDVAQKDAKGFTPEQLAYWYGEFRMGAYTDVCLMIVERLKKGRMPQNA